MNVFFPKVAKYECDTFNILVLLVAIYMLLFFYRKKGEKRAFVLKNGLTLGTGHYLSPVGVGRFLLRHNNFHLNSHKALVV